MWRWSRTPAAPPIIGVTSLVSSGCTKNNSPAESRIERVNSTGVTYFACIEPLSCSVFPENGHSAFF